MPLAMRRRSSGSGTSAPTPGRRGLRYSVAGNRAGHPKSYFSPYRNEDLRDGPKGEYLTDRLTDEACALLDQFAAGGRPFFLDLSFYTVHTPIQAQPDRLAENLARGQPRRVARYTSMVESLDANVGRVLARLDALGLRENTLVVFFSDNGGVGGWTSMAPLRGAKGMLYEGGIREPLIVSWPGRVAGGVTSDALVSGVDLYPTFVELAGGAMPAAQPHDGCSLVGLWTKGEVLAERTLHWHFPAYLEGSRRGGKIWRTTPAAATRRGRFKLIEFFEGNVLELYDVVADPGETQNLAVAQSERARSMHEEMRAWRAAIGAAMPTSKHP